MGALGEDDRKNEDEEIWSKNDHYPSLFSNGANGRRIGGPCSSTTGFRTQTTYASLPSYMKERSGVNVDPDVFRHRRSLLLRLPEAKLAQQHLITIATKWDPVKNGSLRGFESVSLGPTEFKELFRTNFGVLLKPRELGILVSMYDKRGDGRADCSDFLRDFWLLGRQGKALLESERAKVVEGVQV
ncbi:unnamed protein product, partial [Choristocarpus tenellus]